LLTSLPSFLHHTADMVRHKPAVSAEAKPACGQAKSQKVGTLPVIVHRRSATEAVHIATYAKASAAG
jgi:hypothetical protein